MEIHFACSGNSFFAIMDHAGPVSYTHLHKQGILFIDEINCVSETLAPTILQFLQFKTFGTHKVPDGWIIAAAGNPSEYNASVRELDMAALDRVRLIHVEADFGVWETYAQKRQVHPAILSYLVMHPESFYRVEPVSYTHLYRKHRWDRNGFLFPDTFHRSRR